MYLVCQELLEVNLESRDPLMSKLLLITRSENFANIARIRKSISFMPNIQNEISIFAPISHRLKKNWCIHPLPLAIEV